MLLISVMLTIHVNPRLARVIPIIIVVLHLALQCTHSDNVIDFRARIYLVSARDEPLRGRRRRGTSAPSSRDGADTGLNRPACWIGLD